MKYDCIILLGTQPDLETWEFPKQIHQCIETTAELIEAGVSDKVIASGKWSLRVENKKLNQPFKEADRLAELLMEKGVPSDKILRECISEDTISNLYFIKKLYLLPDKMQSVLFVVASFRITRLKLLVSKVFGPNYKVDYKSIPSEETVSYNETRTIERTLKFLDTMEDGDHDWLEDKFYEGSMYAEVRNRHQLENN